MSVKKVTSDQVGGVIVPIFACAMVPPNNVAQTESEHVYLSLVRDSSIEKISVVSPPDED